MGQLEGQAVGQDQDCLVLALVARLPSSLGWASGEDRFLTAGKDIGLVCFCSSCSCFSSFLMGINYCGFIALTGVSGNSDWMNSKN